MNCTKCGKEIPDGENKICEDCQKKLLDEISNEKVEDKEENKDKSNESSNKGKSNGNILLILVVLIALAVGAWFYFNKSFEIKNTVGNSIANIKDYGYTAAQGNYIYYVAPDYEGEKVAIYKAKKDGADIQQLIKDDWDVLSLNVVGDYIYFIAINNEKIESSAKLSEEEQSLDTLNNKIYRMKLDGTDLEVINDNQFNNSCYQIFVIKDKIFYIGVDANIYTMGLDGSNKQKLNDDKTGYIGITENYILFNVEKKQDTNQTTDESADTQVATTTEYETYIMDLDGNNRKALTGQRLYSVNIVDDYIYYTNNLKAVYKVKVDGTDNQLVTDKVNCYNMNISNGKIYYMNYVENSAKIAIYKMDLNGENPEIVYTLENYSSYLNVVDNKVVFMDNTSESGTINMCDENGEVKKLYELNLTENLSDSSDVVEQTQEPVTQENTQETDDSSNNQ